MVGIGGVAAYFNWLCLLLAVIMAKTGNGFRASFYRFADTDAPRFYLTEEEIKNAMAADDTWKIQAEDMDLLTLFKTSAVNIPGHEDMVGLEMERYFSFFRPICLEPMCGE